MSKRKELVMTTQTATKEQIEQMTTLIKQGVAKEHKPRWVYISMAAKAWGITDEAMNKLVLAKIIPTHVVESPKEPKVTYVDAAVAPIKNEDALRWGCAKPEKITYKVSAPVREKAAEVMKMPEWSKLVELYEAGDRWTDETEELLDVLGAQMETVLPNTGNTAGINGILMHAVHTNDAGEGIRIIRALASTSDAGKKHKAKKDVDEDLEDLDDDNDDEEPKDDEFDDPDDDEFMDDEV